MKRSITTLTVVASLCLVGCSTKNGAIIGGTSGAIAGGLLGAVLSEQHVGNGKTVQSALEVGLVLGLAGALVGGTTGYVVDKITSKEDKKMQDMIQFNNQIQKAY